MTNEEAKTLLAELVQMDYTAAIDAIRAEQFKAAQTKHTPGPWRAGYYDDSSGYDCMTGGISIGPNAAGPIHLDGQHYGQKRCNAIERGSMERMLADAQLIAAAPEMLATLKRLKEMCADFGAVTACEVACAAIAKATNA
jgi:hypothetical protein